MSDLINSIGGSSMNLSSMQQVSTSAASGIESSVQPKAETSELGAEQNAIANQQDKTELSDEAEEMSGAAGAAQNAQQAGGVNGQGQIDWNTEIKTTLENAIEESKNKASGIQSLQGNQAGTSAIDMLKQQYNACKNVGGQLDSTISSAAEEAINGNIQKAEQILNQSEQNQGAAQGLNEDQQVGQAGEANVSNIIAGLQGMMQE